jgi:Protein of unknwon function (DUF3310)
MITKFNGGRWPLADRRREAVNHPLHYGGDVPHETWKCLRAWGLESDALLWTVAKYISRAGKKDRRKFLEDLKKAKWYLEKRIEREEGQQKRRKK